LSIRDIDKFPQYDKEPEGSPADTSKRLNLDDYLRQGPGKADTAQADASFWSLWERLDSPPDSSPPPSSMPEPHGQEHGQEKEEEWEGSWRENFAARMRQSELRKGPSLSRYVAVAFLVCGVSGGAFFYFLTRYAAFETPRGPTSSGTRTVAALEYSVRTSEPEPAAPVLSDDVSGNARLAPSPSRDSIAEHAPPPPPDTSRAAVEADRNQGKLVESLASQLAAAQQSAPGDQTSEINPPSGSNTSKAAASDESAGAPAKHTYRTASLSPPPGTGLLDTAIPGAGYAPEEKRAAAKEKPAAAIEKSERSAAVPPPAQNVQSASLAASQESKMLARASELMSENDIAGARLIYEYLANHNSSAGAFALAETYDSRKLARYRVTGMTPDAGLADAWYQRAAALGSKEAAAILRGDKR
jgi:hypothetical protein